MKKNLDKFDVLRGRKPVREFQRIVVPDQLTITYECIVWTEFITQMKIPKTKAELIRSSIESPEVPNKIKRQMILEGLNIVK